MINEIFEPILRRLPENNRLERIWKLAQVDFKKRYYNHALGLLWALLNPLFRVAVYYIVFTQIIEMKRDDIESNYALFLFIGIILWQLFVESAKKLMKILYVKKYLIENIEVAKIDLFLSSEFSIFYGFSFNLIAFAAASLAFGVVPGWDVLYLIVVLFSIFLIGMGVGMILAVVYIFVRDIDHVMDIVFLLGFWTSGVFFKGDIILEKLPPLYYANPFVGIIINARAALLNEGEIVHDIMLINLATAVVIYLFGYYLMKRNAHLALERI